MSQISTAGSHLTEEQRRFYDEQGYVIVRSMFAADEIDAIRERFDQLARAGEPIPEHWEPLSDTDAADDPLLRYPRVMMPHRFDEMSLRHMLDRRLQLVLRDLFGAEPIAAQTMFYYKPPGARGHALHQDNFYLKVHPGTCLAAWTAIDPSTQANGGLRVIPASHKLDVLCPGDADEQESVTTHYVPDPQGRQPVDVDLDPGDVLFFNGSLIHGSPPNTSQTMWRRAFICHYVPADCTHASDFYFPLLDFDGNVVTRQTNEHGGPCGEDFRTTQSSP